MNQKFFFEIEYRLDTVVYQMFTVTQARLLIAFLPMRRCFRN